MNVAIFGNSQVAIEYANAVLGIKGYHLSAIFTLKRKLQPLNPANISKFTHKNNIKCIKIEDINHLEVENHLIDLNIDIVFVEWPKIIHDNILKIPNKYVIGIHPTDLPYARGRHPLHWLICMERKKTKLSFFLINKEVDNGDIVLKTPITIQSNETINTLNNKFYSAVYEGTKKICNQIQNKTIKLKKQNEKKATYFRKRDLHDSIIDPRMTIKSIINHINSFTIPYSCATIIIENEIHFIKSATKLKNKKIYNYYVYGKVIHSTLKYLDLKVIDGTIRVYFKKKLDNLLNVQYIHPPSYYVAKYNLLKN